MFTTSWPQIFLHDLIRFVVIVGLVALATQLLFRWLAGRKPLQPCRLSARQFARESIWTVSTVAIFSLAGWFVHVGPLTPYLQGYAAWGALGLWYEPLSFVLVLIAHDAYFYWTHRLMHTRWLYRHTHRLHHRTVRPTPATAYAFAPGEALLHALFLPLIHLVLPLHPGITTAFVVVMIARNALAHAGVECFAAGTAVGPFRFSTTVTHHDLHHEHGRGNYGFYFTWWDRWMGTERADYVARFRRNSEILREGTA